MTKSLFEHEYTPTSNQVRPGTGLDRPGMGVETCCLLGAGLRWASAVCDRSTGVCGTSFSAHRLPREPSSLLGRI